MRKRAWRCVIPAWPNVKPGTQQSALLDWLYEQGPDFTPTTAEIADFLGFEARYVTRTGTTSWGVTKANSALSYLEKKGLVERVGKGKRGRHGFVCWRRVDIEPLCESKPPPCPPKHPRMKAREEHLVAHKVQDVRILQLEKRVAALEELLVEMGSRLEDAVPL